MRKRLHQQLPITPAPIDHEHARELAEMSAILDGLSEGAELLRAVERDILRGNRADTGRDGMTAEQVLRALQVKQMNGFSYDELAFHLADSTTYRAFCRIGIGDKPPKRSTLQENIKRLRPETLELFNHAVLRRARAEGVEDGRKVRADCTVVETDIHPPTDSSLLNDAVRVLTRLMRQVEEVTGGLESPWSDHTRRARRRDLGISNARTKKRRKELYRDLLHVAGKVVGYAEAVAAELASWSPTGGDLMGLLLALGLKSELEHFVRLARQVIDQTQRRILCGEQVPASEKLFSIFETHTDIIMKGGREPEYGHKVLLSTGRSGLILDCVVLEGNPADSTLIDSFLERHLELFGQPPRQAAFDGGFASQQNLRTLKEAGVEDAAFHKKRALEISDMARSSWVYRRLVRFRAGIESGISFLKRCFGWTRCLWRGFESFVAYVRSAVLTCNLLLLARHRMAQQA
jgi:IS5 family transposase